MSSMKKAAGPDDLLAEHLKEGGPAAVEVFNLECTSVEVD